MPDKTALSSTPPSASAAAAPWRQRLRPYGAAVVTACLIVAPALNESLWPLAWIALAPLLRALQSATPRQAFVLGWCAETLMYWGGFYWLIGTMVDFGYIPLPISVLLFGVIGLGNGLRLGVYAWWVRRTLAPTAAWWMRLLIPACAYVALDMLCPRVFPWYLGFLQLQGLPFIQIADLTGVHGVSFMLVLCSTVLATWMAPATSSLRQGRWAMTLVCVVAVGLQGGYGLWRMAQVRTAMGQAPSLRVALVQPNIGMYDKRSGADRDAQLDLQFSLSATTFDQQPDVIIWPESMYPFGVPAHLTQLPWPALPTTPQTQWLIGALVYAGQGTARQVFNSALLLDAEGHLRGRYDKQDLLAFGEYIPFKETLPFLRHISPAIGNLTPGTGGIVTLANGVGLGPLICYEDILPTLARRAVQQGAQVLVNLTNDVWFGATRAPYQHRALATFRAVEHRVYLIRATNTGLTSILDAVGQEHAVLPLFQADARVHTVHPLRLGSVYTTLGESFAWLCSVLTLGLLLGGWWRRRQASATAA